MTHLVAHPSGVILIQESVTGNTCGLPLFHHLLGKFTTKKQLYFLVTENSVAFHESKIKIAGVQYIDAYTDPLSWTSSPSPSTKQNNSTLCNYTSLQNIIQAIPAVADKESAVFAIDSLSPLLFYHGITKVTQLLNIIKTKFSSVVCLLHRELHDEKVYKQLEYISTYNLELFEPKDKSPSTPFIVSVLHKRVSGKVTDVLENYSYSHDGQVTITNTHKHKNGKVSINTEKAEEDPAANLTFNLKLTPQERSAREEVQLPYIHQEKNTPVVEDEDDDEYEEDPDDDLDI